MDTLPRISILFVFLVCLKMDAKPWGLKDKRVHRDPNRLQQQQIFTTTVATDAFPFDEVTVNGVRMKGFNPREYDPVIFHGEKKDKIDPFKDKGFRSRVTRPGADSFPKGNFFADRDEKTKTSWAGFLMTQSEFDESPPLRTIYTTGQMSVDGWRMVERFGAGEMVYYVFGRELENITDIGNASKSNVIRAAKYRDYVEIDNTNEEPFFKQSIFFTTRPAKLDASRIVGRSLTANSEREQGAIVMVSPHFRNMVSRMMHGGVLDTSAKAPGAPKSPGAGGGGGGGKITSAGEVKSPGAGGDGSKPSLLSDLAALSGAGDGSGEEKAKAVIDGIITRRGAWTKAELRSENPKSIGDYKKLIPVVFSESKYSNLEEYADLLADIDKEFENAVSDIIKAFNLAKATRASAALNVFSDSLVDSDNPDPKKYDLLKSKEDSKKQKNPFFMFCILRPFYDHRITATVDASVPVPEITERTEEEEEE